MAMGTTTERNGAPKMDTPPPVPPAPEPFLAEDTDPVLLVRLFPDKVTLTAARAAAIAQGKATAEAGALTVAAQQEPVAVLGAEPVPATAPTPLPPVTARHPAPDDKDKK